MVETLQEFMCKYMTQQTEALKGCLIAALKSKDQTLSLLDERLGSLIPSNDVKLCELLAKAQLFREEIKVTRDGRNRYKVFHLTETGKAMAQQASAEGFNGKMPLNEKVEM